MPLITTCSPPMVHHSFLTEVFNMQFYNSPATSIFPGTLGTESCSVSHFPVAKPGTQQTLSKCQQHGRIMNGWISAKAFDMWASYHICQSKICFIGFLNSVSLFLLTPFSPLLAALLRGQEALESIQHLSGVCTQLPPQTSLPTLSYLCSQFA